MAKAETVPQAAAISRSELVERARALIPTVRERAAQAEELRRLPPETIEDFKAAGFLRMCVPEKFGGLEHEPDLVTEVALEIGRGDGSSGWLSSFYALHNFMVTWFPEEAQAEYFADGPDTLSCTVPAYATGTHEQVDGGVRLTGRWRFSSGVDYVSWAIVHTPNEVCLVPRSDFEIMDDWYVEGLRGTGSNGVKMENVFVPAHRTVLNEALATGTQPGATLYDSPWQRIVNPAIHVLNHFILAPVIGMANGVLDIFDERARTRLDPQIFQPAIERPGPQLRFAEAHAEIELAKMLLRHNLATVRSWGENRYQPTMEERAEDRRNIVYAAKLCTSATNRLVDGMDSSSLQQSAGLHRLARDVRAGSLQFILQYEETAMQFSRVHWGLEPLTMLI